MPSTEDVRVRFKRGEKDAILAAPVTDGMFYVSTDTNEMFLDSDTAHNQIGGGLTEIPIASITETGGVKADSFPANKELEDGRGVCYFYLDETAEISSTTYPGTDKLYFSFDPESGLTNIGNKFGLSLNPATSTSAGSMSAADKVKLDSLENSVNVAIQGSQPTEENIKIWISG